MEGTKDMRWHEKVVAVLMAMVLAVGLMPLPAHAAIQPASISTLAADTTISTADELVAFASAVNGGETFSGKTVELGGDITVAEDWTAIGGSSSLSFQGEFDGNGHTITLNGEMNGYASGWSKGPAGLFGYIADTAKIHDFVLKGTNKTASVSQTAAVVGQSDKGSGVDASMPEIYNVSNYMNVSGGYAYSGDTYGVGGILGYGVASIHDCANKGDITSKTSGSKPGGIVGVVGSGTAIESCYNTGAISASGSFAGGLVGSSNGANCAISNSYNSGAITAGNTAAAIIGYATYSSYGVTLSNVHYLSSAATANHANGVANGSAAPQDESDLQGLASTLGTKWISGDKLNAEHGKYPALTWEAEAGGDSGNGGNTGGSTGGNTGGNTQAAPATPAITVAGLTDGKVTQGDPVTLTASSDGATSYQWYVASGLWGSFSEVAGATGSTYEPSTSELGTFYYVATASNDAGSSALSSTTPLSNNDKVTVQVVKPEEPAVTTVSDVAGLVAVADKVKSGTTYEGKTVKLTEDIDLSDMTWTPIGKDGSNSFQGTFDGQGHTVTLGAMKESSSYYGVGLFGYVKGATLKNVTIAGAVTSSNYYKQLYTAGLVGYVYGDPEGTPVTTISNVFNLADITNRYASDDAGGVGGIVGATSAKVTIENCANKGTVTAVNPFIRTGGIIGFGTSTSNAVATVDSCYNAGKVVNDAANHEKENWSTGAKTVTSPVVGGIVGAAAGDQAAPVVTGCFYAGTASSANTSETKSVSPISAAGKVTGCYWLGGEGASAIPMMGDNARDIDQAAFLAKLGAGWKNGAAVETVANGYGQACPAIAETQDADGGTLYGEPEAETATRTLTVACGDAAASVVLRNSNGVRIVETSREGNVFTYDLVALDSYTADVTAEGYAAPEDKAVDFSEGDATVTMTASAPQKATHKIAYKTDSHISSTWTPNTTEAKVGEKVFVQPVAESGSYEVASVTAVEASGKDVTVTKVEDYNNYWFWMPDSDVTVTIAMRAKAEKTCAIVVENIDENGTVSCDKGSVNLADGDAFTVTVTPKAGYKLAETREDGMLPGLLVAYEPNEDWPMVSVVHDGYDANEGFLDMVKNDDGTFTFTVDGDAANSYGKETVYVSAVFEEDESYVPGGDELSVKVTSSSETNQLTYNSRTAMPGLTLTATPAGDGAASASYLWYATDDADFVPGTSEQVAPPVGAAAELSVKPAEQSGTTYYYCEASANGKTAYSELVGVTTTAQFYITATPATSGGSYTVNGTAAASDMATALVQDGQDVTIALSPASGYELDTIVAVELDGGQIALTKADASTYTFKMPANEVSIDVTFKVIPAKFGITLELGEGVESSTGVHIGSIGSESVTEAPAGSAMVIAPVISYGYALDKVTATTESGQNVPLTERSGESGKGKFDFTMPAEPITVKVVAKEAGTPIVINGSIEHGTVTSSKESVRLVDGNTFTLTVTPEAGYKMAEEVEDWYDRPGLLVADEEEWGNSIVDDRDLATMTDNGLAADGSRSYTFTLNYNASWYDGDAFYVDARFVEGDAQEISITGGTSVSKQFGVDTEFQIEATCATAEELVYASSNEEVATVDATGKVTIVGAGAADITVTASAIPNYKETSTTVALEVEEGDNPFTISAKALAAKPYNAEGYTIAASELYAMENGDASEVAFLKKSGNKLIAVDLEDGSLVVPAGLPVGTYPVRVVAMASGGQNMKAKAVNVDLTLKVVQAASPLAIAAADQTVTYSADEQVLDAALSLNMGGASFVEATSAEGIKVAADGKVTLPAGLAAGAYTVDVKAANAETANYQAGEATAKLAVTVNKAASSISLKDSKVTFANKAVAFPESGVTKSGSTGKVTYKYYSDAKCTKTATPKNVGTYYVKATLAADDNHLAATTAKAAKLTIVAAQATIKATTAKTVTIAAAKKANQTIKMGVQSNSKGKITYAASKASKGVSFKNGTVTLKKGTYKKGKYSITVKATQAANGNYAKTVKAFTVTFTVK